MITAKYVVLSAGDYTEKNGGNLSIVVSATTVDKDYTVTVADDGSNSGNNIASVKFYDNTDEISEANLTGNKKIDFKITAADNYTPVKDSIVVKIGNEDVSTLVEWGTPTGTTLTGSFDFTSANLETAKIAPNTDTVAFTVTAAAEKDYTGYTKVTATSDNDLTVAYAVTNVAAANANSGFNGASGYVKAGDTVKMASTDSSLSLSVYSTSVNQAEINKVEGQPITDQMAFITKATDLGKSATLTVTTNTRPTAAAPKFANLYRTKADGTLEFVAVAPIDENGKAVIPMSDAGTYTVLVSSETKKPGDLNNDCVFSLADITEALKAFVSTSGTITRDQNFKLDHDGSGTVDLNDILRLLKDFVDDVL